MKNFGRSNSELKITGPCLLNPNEDQDSKNSILCWDAFGKYLKKYILVGNSIKVPKFGIFTFTPPNYINFAGQTNPWQRDL